MSNDTVTGKYLLEITRLLGRIAEEEGAGLASASDAVADVICRDGIIYTFGCGHSHLPCLDTFYRAGGLACTSPMLDDDLMLHNGAAKSSRMEKMRGIASELFRRYSPTPNDIVFVISASGKNAAPVEMCECAKAAGVKLVTLSSSAYIAHGARLLELGDIAIDCKVPHGDAVIDVGEAKMGGLSTYASLFILNSILIEGAQKALERGTVPPIYASGNVEGGTERNVALEKRFFGRVKNL